ncbi:MAG: ABC transporter ATP-binding protein [Gammaproteobacteria bacterium]
MITTTEPDILVSVTGLHRYYGDFCAVRDLAFDLRRGEVLGLLGPNGAGKTTTMNLLAGTLAPSTGSVRLCGHDLLDDPRAAKAAIGYLPERPPLYPDLTVDEYLDYAAGLRAVPRATRSSARDAAKTQCGLADYGRRLIGNLSKGYQQRVGIAQALVHNPSVIILDEPTVGLDPNQIREIRGLIIDLGRDRGVILSTHILPEVLATCTSVKILHRGCLVHEQRVDELTAPGAHTLEQIFIDKTMDDSAA